MFLFLNINYSGDNMSKETFKTFARSHPELAGQVMKNNVSWQKLYELYEIYGENNPIWNDYFSKNNLPNYSQNPAATFKDLVSMIKNIDLDSVQKGVNNLQKTIGLLQDIGLGSTTSGAVESFEPKPLYQYFED